MPNCKCPPQGGCPGTGRRSSSEGQKWGCVGQGSCGASFARREQPGVEAGWHSSRAGISVRPAARPSRGLGGICSHPGEPWQHDGCLAQLSHCHQTVNNRTAQLGRNISSQRMLSTLACVNYFTAVKCLLFWG